MHIPDGKSDLFLLKGFYSPHPTPMYQFNTLTFAGPQVFTGPPPLPFSWSIYHCSPKTLGAPRPSAPWDLLPCVASAPLLRAGQAARGLLPLRGQNPHSAWQAGGIDEHSLQNKCVRALP